jgi:hypothetical protein
MNAQQLIGLAILWTLGGFFGVTARYGMWARKPENVDTAVRVWWHARKGSNIVSICIWALVTGFLLDGSLIQMLGLDGKSTVYAWAMPLGAGFLFFGHLIVATAGKWARTKGGVDASDED